MHVFLGLFSSLLIHDGVSLEAIEIDCASESNFTRGHSSEVNGVTSVGYRRPADGASLSIGGGAVPESRDPLIVWKEQTLSMQLDLRSRTLKQSPSGWAIGDRSVWWPGTGSVRCQAMAGRFYVSASIGYRGLGARGNVSWLKSDPNGDIELLEGAVRHAIARLNCQRFGIGPNVTVNSRVVAGTLRDGDSRIFVPLSAWAQARGISLTRNARLGSTTFAYAEKAVILLLGTDDCKVNNQRRSLGAMLVRKGNEWYAPLNGIEDTIR